MNEETKIDIETISEHLKKLTLEQVVECVKICQQIRDEKVEERLSSIRSLIRDGSITSDMVSQALNPIKVKENKSKELPIIYADNKGNTWTGRGMKPKWVQTILAQGKSLKDFETPIGRELREKKAAEDEASAQKKAERAKKKAEKAERSKSKAAA